MIGFIHFYSLNMDISVAIYLIDLKSSVSILDVLFEGKKYRIVYLCLSFFYDKKGITF